MKRVVVGFVILLVIVGFGLAYRAYVENAARPIACPIDALVCPDGTSVSRTGQSCTFAPCPYPNVSYDTLHISFAVPSGFATTTPGGVPDEIELTLSDSASSSARITVRSYALDASSTPLAVIRSTAIGGASGAPVPANMYTSTMAGRYRVTVVPIERFEGVVHTAYYLSRNEDVLRFDAIDQSVQNWMESSLDVTRLPAHAALKSLLGTLQGG